MPNKLTYKEVEKEFSKRGLKLLDKEYERNNVPLTFINSEGYKGYTKLANLKMDKNPRYFSKYNPYTIENIKTFLQKDGNHSELLSTIYENYTAPLTLKCECGNIYERSVSDMLYQTYKLCPDCALKMRGISQRINFDKVRQGFMAHGFTLLSDAYNSNMEKLECEDAEGYRGFQSYAGVMAGKGLTKYSFRWNPKYCVYNLNHWAKLNNIKAIVIDKCNDNKWTSEGITVRCECGNIFTTSVNSFRNGKIRCEECAKSVSRFEDMVKRWLDAHNIIYIKQYRFKDCKYKITLPFDFYLPDYNMCIEVDGQGHYEIAYYNHCSKEKGLQSLRHRQITDKIKTDYCNKQNIYLLRIPYWEFPNNYKNILYNNLIKE